MSGSEATSFLGTDAAILWDTSTGQKQSGLDLRFPYQEITSLDFSPDGRHIIYAATLRGIRSSIGSWELSTNNVKTIAVSGLLIGSVDISNNGHLIVAYVFGNPGAFPPRPSSLKIFLRFQENVNDQVFFLNQPITPLILPEVFSGVPPLNYTLTPELPPGLTFDASNRTITGTPTNVTAFPVEYTYTATDATGSSGSLKFNISVEILSTLEFSSDISDQRYIAGMEITPLVLPEVIGGVSPINYTLTPTLPTGLTFDASSRTIKGTPAETFSPVEYTYAGTDATGSSGVIEFKIHVYTGVSVESKNSLPDVLTIVGNYPNPFRQSTQLIFDLPWPAHVQVEVMDVIGRQLLIVSESHMEAGWGQTIGINGASLPMGLYLYRVTANSDVERAVQVGQIIKN